MPKYYTRICDRTKIELVSGSSVALPPGFNDLASVVISRCSYIQSLIQDVIFASHGPEIVSSKATLSKIPNPKARMEFLCSFEYDAPDPVIAAVFKYAQKLVYQIYELRCVLAHEKWQSCADIDGVVLFTSLKEEARYLTASAMVEHQDETTPQSTYDAIIRYIEKIKVVSLPGLHDAVKDAELCSWILMTLSHILKEPDEFKKADLRKAFFVYKGTAHLFENNGPSHGTISVISSKSSSIYE